MNKPKAIERLESEQGLISQELDPGYHTALQLGIEALEWLNQWKGKNSSLANVRLPSETED